MRIKSEDPYTRPNAAADMERTINRHKSILDYLQTNGYTETLSAFKGEAHLPDFQPDPKAKWSGLLEKKWTSVIRLQKKVQRREAAAMGNAAQSDVFASAPDHGP